ncbi:VOC family protein [Fictibacillus phosphorivorans]|uniref:VOC family protein n=1 Tax=Fictibacillus phosphorivorans TaxID=1221500 RepID=UPI0012935A92|nr:VOC family protein [Fictibacillus phosphorivorans]MQR93866.1 VOC family protein [Fictibacillus phosphorivorans]
MLHHIGLYVGDMKTSCDFYEKILPIEKKESFMWNDTELIFLVGKGYQLELMPILEDHAGFSHIAFSVISVTEKINELSQKEIFLAEGPYDLPNGWRTVFYEGPDGEEIEFIQTNL